MKTIILVLIWHVSDGLTFCIIKIKFLIRHMHLYACDLELNIGKLQEATIKCW